MAYLPKHDLRLPSESAQTLFRLNRGQPLHDRYTTVTEVAPDEE